MTESFVEFNKLTWQHKMPPVFKNRTPRNAVLHNLSKNCCWLVCFHRAVNTAYTHSVKLLLSCELSNSGKYCVHWHVFEIALKGSVMLSTLLRNAAQILTNTWCRFVDVVKNVASVVAWWHVKYLHTLKLRKFYCAVNLSKMTILRSL